QAPGWPRRAVRVQEPGRALAGRGADRAGLGALPAGASREGRAVISRRSLLPGAILGAGAIAAGLGRPRPARAAGVTPADWQPVVGAGREGGQGVVHTRPGHRAKE